MPRFFYALTVFFILVTIEMSKGVACMLNEVACDMLSSVREIISPERVLRSETLPHLFVAESFFVHILTLHKR